LETDGLFGEKTEAAVEKTQTALKVIGRPASLSD
jgi:hypothetical protein